MLWGIGSQIERNVRLSQLWNLNLQKQKQSAPKWNHKVKRGIEKVTWKF